MTLAGSTGTNTPLLVNRVSFFVEPEGGVIEIRGRFRREAAFLFFDEDFLKIGSMPAVVLAILEVLPVGAIAMR